ncbi:MAG: hypothetical protein O3C67_06725 [Cyanobacteria bacterium]|nr:hypothetical protein [Cyanobacteriota bacterium]MEB3267657.1 hypothetical protein [Leptolyngbya sp.]
MAKGLPQGFTLAVNGSGDVAVGTATLLRQVKQQLSSNGVYSGCWPPTPNRVGDRTR